MELNILDIAPVISDTKTCVQFLRGRNLLLQDYHCCRNICKKVADPNVSDHEIFQCSTCRHRYSIRTGSFWAKSKLQLTILVSLLFFFCKGSSVKESVQMLVGKVTKKSVIQWYNYFRDVMTCYFQNNPVTFINTHVHIDETFIGGKRKYHRGRVPQVGTRYLVGIIDKNSHKVYIEFVPKRDFVNMIPLITRHVMPGCIINTDGARVYNHLNSMNYVHNVVIHKDNFVDPVTGTHTNWIEGFWGNLKMKIKSIRGSQKTMLDGHMDEFMYRFNRKSEGCILELMMNDIALYYPI